MADYFQLSKDEVNKLYEKTLAEYTEFQARNLSLDMSRGKPSFDQISISNDLLTVLKSPEDCRCETGADCRNYGLLLGIPEMKRLFSELLEVPADNIIVGGNSSLNMMYDFISKGFTHGFPESKKPWCKEKHLKFLCPVPGYDRHFAVTQSFGMELIPVPMLEDGPDMDLVEKLVKDKSVKGIWCVPKYSNPEGKTYSDEVVRRFAKLKPAAKDFKIMWDNAYCVHDVYGDGDVLLSLYDECVKQGNENMVVIFASTSKMSFPGGGVACMASGKELIDYIASLMKYQTISADKINQLRHARYFKNKACVLEHMNKHAEAVRPKFDVVLNTMDAELSGTGCGSWTKPKGGYFISFDAPDGCAKRIVQLAKEAGVVLTPAGATWPYGIDPKDSNIRIAPTYPCLEDIALAAKLFCICVRLATLEKLVKE